MAGFIFLYRGGAPQVGDLSPQQMQAHLGRWDEWVADLTQRGVLRGAQALGTGGRTVGPEGAVVDGPFAESKEVVGGFSLIDVSDIDEAEELARHCPIYEFAGHVEIRPVVERCLDPDA